MAGLPGQEYLDTQNNLGSKITIERIYRILKLIYDEPRTISKIGNYQDVAPVFDRMIKSGFVEEKIVAHRTVFAVTAKGREVCDMLENLVTTLK